MHRAIEGLPASEFRRAVVPSLLEHPHSAIRPLSVLAGTIGDRGEQTARLGIEQVAIVHEGVHDIDGTPVHAQLRLRRLPLRRGRCHPNPGHPGVKCPRAPSRRAHGRCAALGDRRGGGPRDRAAGAQVGLAVDSVGGSVAVPLQREAGHAPNRRAGRPCVLVSIAKIAPESGCASS